VHEAVESAHKAFKSGVWSKAPRHVRADVLDKIGDQMLANLDDLINLEVLQTGRAIREMKAQVPSLVKWYKYYASLIRVEERSVLPTTGKLHNWVDRVPIGVVAQITPLWVFSAPGFAVELMLLRAIIHCSLRPRKLRLRLQQAIPSF
jgi:acyl-CoA reductase-like NAD-dependent aldehyde dehydrogenase